MSRQSISIINPNQNHFKTIVTLAWPIFIEQLLISLVQAADSAMVGSLGAAATAAVAINYAPQMLVYGVILALGVGFTSLVARSVGAGDADRARHLTKQSILIVTVISIPLTLLCYGFAREIPIWMGGRPEILDAAEDYNQILSYSMLFRSLTMVLTAIYRGYGNSKTPMIINVLVNILNVIGNFLMIYPTRPVTLFGFSFTLPGLGWGVAGAAWSTSIAGILGGAAMLCLCFFKKSPLQITPDRGFAPDWKELREVVRISFPAMLERFIMGSAFIVVGHATATLGTAAVAAQNLAANAESISFMPGFAFGASTTTLFGQSIGAGREDLARLYVVKTIRIGSVIMLAASILMYAGSSGIMKIFTPDTEVISMGSDLLKILAVIQVPQMIAMVYSGALKGAGDSRSPFLITLVSMWGIRLLGTLLCVYVFRMGIVAVCVCTCVDNAVRCLMFFLRFRQGAWEKQENQ